MRVAAGNDSRHQTPEAPLGHITFSDRLAHLVSEFPADRVGVGALVNALGRRSIGAVLLVLALPMALPVPTPGFSILFGVPLILVSVQMVLGRRTVWLPAAIAAKSVRRSDLFALINRALPLLRRLERVVHPRLACLATGWMLIPVGAICAVLGVIIALPIPLGHVGPGTAISILALGLIERDGLTIGLGMLAAAVATAVVVAATLGLAGGVYAWFAV